jgi:hypothetical protein
MNRRLPTRNRLFYRGEILRPVRCTARHCSVRCTVRSGTVPLVLRSKDEGRSVQGTVPGIICSALDFISRLIPHLLQKDVQIARCTGLYARNIERKFAQVARTALQALCLQAPLFDLASLPTTLSTPRGASESNRVLATIRSNVPVVAASCS